MRGALTALHGWLLPAGGLAADAAHAPCPTFDIHYIPCIPCRPCPPGLLHDTVEDCGDVVGLEEINFHFGPAVRRIVEGETKFR